MLTRNLFISLVTLSAIVLNFSLPTLAKEIALTAETQAELPSLQVKFLQEAKSNKIHPGDEIIIEATENYIKDGTVIINQGSRGSITVVEAKKKGFIDGGHINLGEGHILAANGQPIKINVSHNQVDGKTMFQNPLFWVSIAMWPMEILEFAHNNKVDKFNSAASSFNSKSGGLFNIKKKSKDYFWTMMSWPLMFFAGSHDAKIKQGSKDLAFVQAQN